MGIIRSEEATPSEDLSLKKLHTWSFWWTRAAFKVLVSIPNFQPAGSARSEVLFWNFHETNHAGQLNRLIITLLEQACFKRKHVIMNPRQKKVTTSHFNKFRLLHQSQTSYQHVKSATCRRRAVAAGWCLLQTRHNEVHAMGTEQLKQFLQTELEATPCWWNNKCADSRASPCVSWLTSCKDLTPKRDSDFRCRSLFHCVTTKHPFFQRES